MQEEGQYWREGVLVLTSPDTAGRGFTVPGRSLAGDHTQTQESRMVAEAISFVTVDRCFEDSRSCLPAILVASGSRCTTSAECKTICIAAYSVMYDS